MSLTQDSGARGADGRMRVLHYIYDDPANPWLGGGGAERVLEIYRRLTDELDVTVVAGSYPGALDQTRDGVRYEFVGSGRSYALSRLTYGLAASRRMRRADCSVQVFDFSVYTPLRVPDRGRIGHVVHMPIGPTARQRWGRVVGGLVAWRERRMLGRARRVSTTSVWMAELLRPLIAPGGGIEIVRSGVGEEFFGVERAESDYLLFYGRFDWFQKGLDVLLEVLETLLAEADEGSVGGPGGGLRAVIAGRGKDAERVQSAVASLGCRERVEVVVDPSRERVLELMAGARLLLHPSRFEGYPVVPAEAMAAGVPVVATDVGAVSEILGRPPAGALAAPDDPDALAGAARRLLSDGELRHELSAAARSRARELTWARVAREHLRFLESLRDGIAPREGGA